MRRKARSDSKLDNLPRAQFVQLREKLLRREFKSYQDAVEWLSLECSVSTQVSSVWSFYQRHCKPVRDQEQKFAAMRAEAFAAAMEKNPIDFDAIAIDKAKQAFFEVMESPEPDLAAMKTLAGIVFKDRATRLDDRKLKLLEEKAKRAEEAEGVQRDEKLSTEEKAARMKEIFGLS